MIRWLAIAAGGVGAAAATMILLERSAYAKTREEVAAKVAAGGSVRLRLTGYWPWAAKTEAERKTEGAPVDRLGRPLHTLEDFLAGKSDHVSLSGDTAAWPYGQKLIINVGGRQIVGRVVDTGSHFRGAGKVYKETGAEPIDVCVFTRATAASWTDGKVVDAQIPAGDHWDKRAAALNPSAFKGQVVSVGSRRRASPEPALDLELLGAQAA